MTSQEIQGILDRDMTGWTLVPETPLTDAQSDVCAQAMADAVSPSLASLQSASRVGMAATLQNAAVTNATISGGATDDYIVLAHASDASLSDGPGPKSVVISGALKKVIGAQG